MYTEKSRAAILVVYLMGAVFVGTFIFRGLGVCTKVWRAYMSVGLCFVRFDDFGVFVGMFVIG